MRTTLAVLLVVSVIGAPVCGEAVVAPSMATTQAPRHQLVTTVGFPSTKLQYGYHVTDWLSVGASYRSPFVLVWMGGFLGPRVDAAWGFYDDILTVGVGLEGSLAMSYGGSDGYLGVGVIPSLTVEFHQPDSIVTMELRVELLVSTWNDHDPDEYEDVEAIQYPTATIGMRLAVTDNLSFVAHVGLVRVVTGSAIPSCIIAEEGESLPCYGHLTYGQFLAGELGFVWLF